jgi:acetyl esterase
MKSKLIAAALASALIAAPAVASDLEPYAKSFAAAAAKGTPLYDLSYDGARNVLATVQKDPLPSGPTTTEDVVWPGGPTGELPIRIVRPADIDGDLPVIMYFHGGGWVMGNRNTHDHLIRELALKTGAAVVFVDYVNAPAMQYPDNDEQAYAALFHVASHGQELKLDSSRIAVAGDSAGGNMAIAVTMLAKQRNGPRIVHQTLFYPVTDDVSNDATYREFGKGPYLTRKAMDYFLGANFTPGQRKDVLAFPLKASIDQLRGLPSATVIVAENDLLRAEGQAYAAKLREAGVSATSTTYKGTIHDFVMLNALADSEPAKAAINQASSELLDAFARAETWSPAGGEPVPTAAR